MKRISLIYILALVLIPGLKTEAQETKRLSLAEVINLAEEQSPNALMAKHRFRASYWQFRTFQAEYRPSLTLTGTLPDYTNSYSRQWNSTQKAWEYPLIHNIQNIGTLSLAQNIGLTGGSIALTSKLQFDNDFVRDTSSFVSSPVSIMIRQPLLRYNELKWKRKIEPLKYEEARKKYISDIENVHVLAVQNFFSLALAQINREIAQTNLQNADTLFQIAKGRYNLGTIAEDELLQMELSYLNAGTAINESEITLRDRELKLRSFLGFNANVKIELVIPSEIPSLEINMAEVLRLAEENNPDLLGYERQLVEAASSVAQARAEKGLNANLTAEFGFQDRDNDFIMAYTDVYKQKSRNVSVGITLPIVDWGLGRGRYKMAKSSQELTQVQVEQSRIDFEQNLLLDVQQFNLQDEQVKIAAKSDTVAAKMYEVTKQRFLIGKIDVLELNNADTKKDQNKRSYIQSLNNYWNYFYNIRAVTLYDFLNGKPLETDYDKLIE